MAPPVVHVTGQTARLTKRPKQTYATTTTSLNESKSSRQQGANVLYPIDKNNQGTKNKRISPATTATTTTLLILMLVLLSVLMVTYLVYSEMNYDLSSKQHSYSSATTTTTSTSLQNDLMILAFYYPWYTRDDWSQHDTQGSSPMLGHYGSNDSEIAEHHIDMALRGGIDAWVVSWSNNQDNILKANLEQGMLRASNLHKIKFCMLYESIGNLPMDSDFAANSTNGTTLSLTALDTFISDMIFFRDNYFDHSSYLYIHERPVVYIYVTREWKNFEPSMLTTIQTAVGKDILFIADDPYFGYNMDPATAQNGIKDGKPVFDAYTSYNMYENELIIVANNNEGNEGETTTTTTTTRAVDYMLREAFPIFLHWSKETIFFPHVLPKYHDFRTGHAPLVGDAAGLLKQLQTFACLPRPSSSSKGYKFPHLLFVTSFNEWWEGTSIEPDAENKYGYTFLDTIKAFKDDSGSAAAQCRQRKVIPVSHNPPRWYDLEPLWHF